MLIKNWLCRWVGWWVVSCQIYTLEKSSKSEKGNAPCQLESSPSHGFCRQAASTLFWIMPDTTLHPCNCCKLMEEREPIMIRLIAEPRGPTFTTAKDWLTAPIYQSYPSFPYVIYPHNLRCITNLSRFKSHLLFIYWSFIWQTKYK